MTSASVFIKYTDPECYRDTDSVIEPTRRESKIFRKVISPKVPNIDIIKPTTPNPYQVEGTGAVSAALANTKNTASNIRSRGGIIFRKDSSGGALGFREIPVSLDNRCSSAKDEIGRVFDFNSKRTKYEAEGAHVEAANELVMLETSRAWKRLGQKAEGGRRVENRIDSSSYAETTTGCADAISRAAITGTTAATVGTRERAGSKKVFMPTVKGTESVRLSPEYTRCEDKGNQYSSTVNRLDLRSSTPQVSRSKVVGERGCAVAKERVGRSGIAGSGRAKDGNIQKTNAARIGQVVAKLPLSKLKIVIGDEII